MNEVSPRKKLMPYWSGTKSKIMDDILSSKNSKK
jgi:hypothetical protein